MTIGLFLLPLQASSKRSFSEPSSKWATIPITVCYLDTFTFDFHLAPTFQLACMYREAPICPLHIYIHPAVKHRRCIFSILPSQGLFAVTTAEFSCVVQWLSVLLLTGRWAKMRYSAALRYGDRVIAATTDLFVGNSLSNQYYDAKRAIMESCVLW